MLNFYKLEQRIEQGMQKGHVPGLALAIVKDQEVIYARGFGVTSIEDGGVPVTPQTLFRIGSTTKPMTGTAILRLVEAGKLDLDRPVKKYIDWLTLSEEDAADRVTLHAHEPYCCPAHRCRTFWQARPGRAGGICAGKDTSLSTDCSTRKAILVQQSWDMPCRLHC